MTVRVSPFPPPQRARLLPLTCLCLCADGWCAHWPGSPGAAEEARAGHHAPHPGRLGGQHGAGGPGGLHGAAGLGLCAPGRGPVPGEPDRGARCPCSFVFVLLGPENAGMDYHEVGRSISTLMSNQVLVCLLWNALSPCLRQWSGSLHLHSHVKPGLLWNVLSPCSCQWSGSLHLHPHVKPGTGMSAVKCSVSMLMLVKWVTPSLPSCQTRYWSVCYEILCLHAHVKPNTGLFCGSVNCEVFIFMSNQVLVCLLWNALSPCSSQTMYWSVLYVSVDQYHEWSGLLHLHFHIKRSTSLSAVKHCSVSVLASVHCKMVSMCLGKPICAPSHLSEMPPALSLKQFQ